MPGVVRAGGQVGLGRRRPKRYMRVWGGSPTKGWGPSTHARSGGERAVGDRGASSVGKARAKRASNMLVMSVTPEVFQLEMSASKLSSSLKSSLMSEISETSQLAMGPYLLVAKASLALYS